jgi:DNA-binding LacI/PurR family transcriptional regulator
MNKSKADTPTMAVVAELAGVSPITVSRALRGSDLVRPELRERIVEVARKAGYRMNVAARSLRTRRSQVIAVVTEQLTAGDRPISDPLILQLIGGLIEVLTPADYALLLTTGDHFLGSRAAEADAVVMLGQGEGGQLARAIAGSGLPMVTWGAPVPNGPTAVIGSDNRGGGRLAAEHMVEIGRRRILFLGDAGHPEVAARLDGVREVLATRDAALVATLSCSFSRAGGSEAVLKALDDGITFDAVIAVSDYIAAGACDTLIRRGIAIPDAVAVIGFDDISVAANHRPPISSIRQDLERAGRTLGEAILTILADPGAATQFTPLPVELVVRETTAG